METTTKLTNLSLLNTHNDSQNAEATMHEWDNNGVHVDHGGLLEEVTSGLLS